MKLFSLAIATIALALPISYASAATFTAPFPSSGSTVVDNGFNGIGDGDYCCFFTGGDSLTQTFTGTGLSSVDMLSLSIPLSLNVLAAGEVVDFDVLLDGTTVGSLEITSAEGVFTDDFSSSFSPISSAGTYTVELLETNTVPIGEGSIGLNDGSLTLNGTSSVSATPEPGTMALFGTGLFGIGLANLRRRLARP